VTRIFGRGQLKVALLQVAAELGQANGYAIMQALDERVGGSWRPSPGAIYPALLALEDAGMLEGEDAGGTRRYRVTDEGRRSLAGHPDVIDAVAGRARSTTIAPTTVGRVLDALVKSAPHRDRALGAVGAAQLEARVRVLFDEIDHLTSEERA
jgi:DNA-binding PadR family transcriptional regulator